MKYLDHFPELDLLSHALSFTSPSVKVSTRIEAYSCKAVSKERKMFKNLEADIASDLSLSTSISPPEHHNAMVDSVFGPLDQRASRKTLWLLIATLNQAFPDYDFARVRPEEFVKEESANGILSSLSNALHHLRAPGVTSFYRSFSSYPPPNATLLNSQPGQLSQTVVPKKKGNLPGLGTDDIPTHPFLRQVLNPVIDLDDCEVYSYTPDIDSDPHASESDDEESVSESPMDPQDETPFQMDGLPSVPPTPMRRRRKARSGNVTPSISVLSYNADDQEGGGLLWSTNFFLYSKKMKRVVFISVWGKKINAAGPITRGMTNPFPNRKHNGETTSLDALILDPAVNHTKRSSSVLSLAQYGDEVSKSAHGNKRTKG